MNQPHETSSLWPSVMAVALTSSSFLAGMVVGRKLGWLLSGVRAISKVGPTKMALVVQGDLKMGRGKLSAQCCHGALAAYRHTQQHAPHLLQAWEYSGQAKVVLKVNSEQDMRKIVEEAKRAGVSAVCVRDAGRTQVPRGSLTVVAVGPDSLTRVDKITGHLKLL